MDDKLKCFLQESDAARKIKLPGKAIIHRTQMSASDIHEYAKGNSIGPIPKNKEICELEIGGEFIASGKIVVKRGEYFFKVNTVFDETLKKGGKV